MSLKFKIFKHGISLIELILALVLLSAVIMTGLSMELGLRRIYTSADLEAQLLADASPIVALVSRDVFRGIGCAASGCASPFENPSAGVYRIRYDLNSNGRWDGYPTDTAAQYTYNGGASMLLYRNSLTSGDVLLSRQVSGFTISAPANGVSIISLQLRANPASPAGYTNPEVNVTSAAQYRGYSIH